MTPIPGGPHVLRPLALAILTVSVVHVVHVVHVAHAAPALKGKEEAVYFPTKEGATRVYEVQEGGKVLMAYTDVVTKVEKKDATIRVTLTRDYTAGGFRDATTIAVSDEGLFRVAVNGKELTKPILLLKTPPKVGTKWEVDAGAEYRVTKEEEVEVPAGKFKAVRVELVGGESTTILWFAPAVGLIKMDGGGGEQVTVLKEFKAGK
jgi:hypothetical protein